MFTLADDFPCPVGMYVMVIGAYIAAESRDNYPSIKVPYSSPLMSAPVFFYAFFQLFTEYWWSSVCCRFTENWRFSFCYLCSLILLQTSF
jgi:hypothetical protein